MFHRIIVLSIYAFSIVACQNDGAETSETQPEVPETPTEEETMVDGEIFGERMTEDGAMPYSVLVNKVPESDSLLTKVVGTVEAVCQKKGCWMTIVSDQEGVPNMMVRFKDYGFFVPKDISGRQVVMEGYAFREETSVEDLRHYAEDEGLPQEEIDKITEPEEEIKFLASGVIVLND